METTFLDVLDKVLKSSLLDEDLIVVPKAATDFQVKAEEKKLAKHINPEYKSFLEHYNGLNLDIVRFHGVDKTEAYIKSLSSSQNDIVSNGIVIGDDPAGYYYIQDSSGKIYSSDSKADSTKYLASSFSSFITDVVFGRKAEEFAGAEWKSELEEAEII